MTTSSLAVTLRPFQEADYARYVEIRTLATPDSPSSETIMRHDDSNWDHERHFFLRLMAEDATGRVVGGGQLRHMPWQFHPEKYHLSVHVDPAFQRRGVGSAIYARFLEVLRERNALLVRADAQETMSHSVDFLTHRGFTDVQRSWESRLRVRGFDFAAFGGAEERVTKQGIVLTTVEAEGLLAAPDDRGLRAVYELDCLCTRDEPSLDPTTVHSFEGWRKDVVQAPNFLPAAALLAKDGERYVGLSFLFGGKAVPEEMGQGFTAEVVPVHVRQSPCNSPASSRAFSTAGVPPTRCKSFMT